MFTTPRLIVIALCAALNFALGTVVYLVKLPIYLNSVGTILCALLLAPARWAAFVCACLAGIDRRPHHGRPVQSVPSLVPAHGRGDRARLGIPHRRRRRHVPRPADADRSPSRGAC